MDRMKIAFTVLCSLAILTAVGTGTAFADAGVDSVAAENVAPSLSLSRATSLASVTFTEAKPDFDDGVPNYDLDFYTATHEYDYEINAQTGAIMDKSVKVNEHAVRETKPAATAAPTAAATEAARGFIGVDRAKSIALGHAGVSASSVSFSKAKLDDDDGRGVYEIEFYVGNTEYDYEIDAHSGAILEASADND